MCLNDAGDYSGLTDGQKKRQLIQRVEDLISTETSKCFAFDKTEQQQESAKLSTQATSSPTTSQGIDNSEKKVVSADQDTRSLHFQLTYTRTDPFLHMIKHFR